MKTGKPISAHVLISNQCPNDCIFCATADKRNGHTSLSPGDVQQFITKAQTSGVTDLIFSGLGEPTLDPFFEDYLALAGSLGFKSIRVFTNGFNLTQSRALRWKSLGLTDVLLSIHGLAEGHDENVRRIGAFEETIKSLDIYSRLQLNVNVNTCITKLNINQIIDLIGFLRPYGVKIHSLAFPEWAGNAPKNIALLVSYEEVCGLCDKIKSLKIPNVFFDNIPYCMASQYALSLRNGRSVLYLDSGGEKVLNPYGAGIYHQLCQKMGCRYRSICSGFDKRYVEAMGWGRIPDMIHGLLNRDERGLGQLRSIANEDMTTKALPGTFAANGKSQASRRDCLTVIMRPTDRCNARCVYCSSHKSIRSSDMTLESLGLIYHKIHEYAGKAAIKNLTFIWHGGEPLLMGKDFYSSAWRNNNGSPIRSRHLIQTNLLEIDEEWIGLFRECNIELGTSVDPFSSSRGLDNDREQYHQWIANLMKICEGQLKIGIVFTVVNDHMDMVDKIYSFFKNIQALSASPIGIKLNPVYAAGRAGNPDAGDCLVSPGQYAEFMLRLYDFWNDDNRPFFVSPFSELGEIGEQSCEYSGQCHNRFLSIDSSGNVFNCARFADSGITFGNLFQESFDDIVRSSNRLKLFEREDRLRETDCKSCEFWDFCHGGCPYHAWLYKGDELRKSPFCDAYRQIFVRVPLNRLANDRAGRC